MNLSMGQSAYCTSTILRGLDTVDLSKFASNEFIFVLVSKLSDILKSKLVLFVNFLETNVQQYLNSGLAEQNHALQNILPSIDSIQRHSLDKCDRSPIEFSTVRKGT